MSAATRIVVVGNGMAGARFVEGLVAKRGRAALDIAVFGDEGGGCYNRILLSGLLAGTYRADDIVTNPVEWYAANGVRLHAGVRATRLDLSRQLVCGEGGIEERYDALVLATGSRPFIPNIQGLRAGDGAQPVNEPAAHPFRGADDAPLKQGAFVFRTVADCEGMLARTRAARTAAVIGGGLLGIEAARGLRNHGLDVTVVHLSPHVMNRELDPMGGRTLERQLEGMGMRLLTERSTVRVLGSDHVRGLRFADGSSLDCDMVVVATGIMPNVALAEEAGLTTQRGILVGDDLGCPGRGNTYAIGECAEHRGVTYGLVAPVWEQADVLSDRLSGRAPQALYRGSRLTTRLKVAGVDVAVMGEMAADPDDEVISYSEPSRGIYKRLVVRENRLIGAILIGSGGIVPTLTQHFLDAAPLAARRSDLLFPPAIDAPMRPVNEIPDTARICDCNAVSKGQIVQAVLKGARSMQSIREATRACTGCGSCRPEVQRIVDAANAQMDASGSLEAIDGESFQGGPADAGDAVERHAHA
jgi:nitrite reductase (NADH) large subunit